MNVKTILLVDDDLDVLEPLQYLLIEMGHNVITALNGNQAIIEYKENKPDIIFMDIKMPELDGYETFCRIIKMDKNAKIIFTSAYKIDDEKFHNAEKMGLCGLIVKPFDINSIVNLIKKYSE